MIPSLQAIDESDSLSLQESAEPADRLTMIFLILGLIASVVAFLSLREALRTQLKPGEFYSPNIVKSQLFYLSHGVHIALLLIAGAVAFLSTDWRAIKPGYLWGFLIFIVATLLMTLRGYPASQLFLDQDFRRIRTVSPVYCHYSFSLGHAAPIGRLWKSFRLVWRSSFQSSLYSACATSHVHPRRSCSQLSGPS